MIRLTTETFNQRAVLMTARFDHLGETVIEDLGEGRELRKLRWYVQSPSGDPCFSVFDYAEWYVRADGEWQMVKYVYEYVDRLRPGRRSYHCHDLLPALRVPHAHCEFPLGSPRSDHFRFVELELVEAHEDFEHRYASELPISCDDLRELRRDQLPA